MPVDIKVAGKSNYMFSNVNIGDLIFAFSNPTTPVSGVHFGVLGNSNPIFSVTSSNTYFGGCNNRIVFVNNKIGVNNSNPQYSLDVIGDVNLTGILRQNGTFYQSSQFSSLSNNVYLAATSNLGIGLSNPQYPLDIVGDLNLSGIIRQNGIPFTGPFKTTGCNIYVLNSNLGIKNSTPQYPLDVTGDINFTGNLRQNGGLYQGSQFTTNGSNIYITDSNVGIGTSNPQYPLHVSGQIYSTDEITAFSDARYKTNLEPIESALDKLLTLTGYTFNVQDPDTNIIRDKRSTGLLAQDVEKVLPEAVTSNVTLSIAYGNLAGLIVESIKELKKELDELKFYFTK